MLTTKDIEYRSVFVINCMENKALRVKSGELLLEDTEQNKVLTKIPFQKILALFAIGHITLTTALIDKCTKFSVPIVVMKPNFRPVFYFSATAEANYLLRQKQYELDKSDLQIPKVIVTNKIKNQYRLIEKTCFKKDRLKKLETQFLQSIDKVQDAKDYETIMGIEGRISKTFFTEYYEPLGWKSRSPRAKTDPLNVTLDIGYTILFNYIEAFVRLFGFDPYIGVYHRVWFRRKSLICDLMEPFRCIIDQQTRKAFNLKQCKSSDFKLFKNEYMLKLEKNSAYTKMYFDVLIAHKTEIFKYVRDYYRCFMQRKSTQCYPQFIIK